MELTEIIKLRHSVRTYSDKALPADVVAALRTRIETCNAESGLFMQLVTDEPKAFSGTLAHYGKFSGVSNYIALVGKKSPWLDELCGYYGEQIVLLAQQLGLNTCWVGMTYSKILDRIAIHKGEKLCAVIAIGYGLTQGVPHKIKTFDDVVEKAAGTDFPQWFRRGVEAALLAPTAVNQQKFKFALHDKTVSLKAGWGFFAKVDLGIVRYHFEIGAGTQHFTWKRPLL